MQGLGVDTVTNGGNDSDNASGTSRSWGCARVQGMYGEGLIRVARGSTRPYSSIAGRATMYCHVRCSSDSHTTVFSDERQVRVFGYGEAQGRRRYKDWHRYRCVADVNENVDQEGYVLRKSAMDHDRG